MLNYRTLLVFIASVLATQLVVAQRFQRIYENPELIGFINNTIESSDSYVIQGVQVVPESFTDLVIDKQGNFVSFNTLPIVPTLTSVVFCRRQNSDMVIVNNESDTSAIVTYFDSLGTVEWNQSIKFTGNLGTNVKSGELFASIEIDGGFLFLGSIQGYNAIGELKNYLLEIKADFNGNVIFQTQKETIDRPIDIRAKSYLGKVFVLWTIQDFAGQTVDNITTTDIIGNWANSSGYLDPALINYVTDFKPDETGGVTITGRKKYKFGSTERFGWAISFDENLQMKWQKPGWPELEYLANRIGIGGFTVDNIAKTNTGWVISGLLYTPSISFKKYNSYISLLDSVGNITKLSLYETGTVNYNSLINTTDGGFLLSYYNPYNSQIGVIKTDSNLVASPNLVLGHITQDPNLNCLVDTLEPAMTSWIIALTSTQDTVLSFVLLDGTYELPADTGSYQLNARGYNPYWEACANDLPLYYPTENIKDTIDFNLQAAVECPQMEVDISLPFARRCFDNFLYINYCNNGTVAADSARLEVILDPAFSYVSSQIPVSAVHGDTLLFNLGNVAVNACNQFNIKVHIDCDSTQIGQTVCVSAHIFPDSFCISLPAWSGGQLAVGGFCEQDSVIFWAKNVGTAATQQLDYVIIEDIVVWKEDSFAPLLPGQTDTVKVKANGSTYGLLAEQEPGYPFNAFSPLSNGPSAWVEACNWSSGGTFPGGFITQFPNEDGNPVTATDCAVLVGSFDPNDKTASPQGVGDKHYILPGTPLEYLIRFQNTGTDTAFTVVVRDDLPPQLDPLSLEVLTSSHPYKVAFENGDILKFTFDHILLPDSNVNEAASHGFVKFRIRPRTDVPMGTLVENTAAIFFDFNPPVYTNVCFHTIDSNFLKTSGVWSPPVLKEKNGIAISPNPAGKHAVIRMIGRDEFSGMITICDVSGKPVAVVPAQNGKMQLPASLLPGCYFLKAGDGWVSQLMVM